jgi:hypothetical protein
LGGGSTTRGAAPGPPASSAHVIASGARQSPPGPMACRVCRAHHPQRTSILRAGPTLPVTILSPAESDLEEGYQFYDSQSPGLGSYFLNCLYSDIDSLAHFGGIHSALLIAVIQRL